MLKEGSRGPCCGNGVAGCWATKPSRALRAGGTGEVTGLLEGGKVGGLGTPMRTKDKEPAEGAVAVPRNWRCSGDGTLEAGCWGWKPTCLASPAPGSTCSPGSDSQDPNTRGSLHRHVLLRFQGLPSSWKCPRGSLAASLRPQPRGLPQLGFSAASLQPPVPGEAGGDHLLSPTAGLKWFSWGARGARAIKHPTSAQVMTRAPGTIPELVSPLSEEPAHPRHSARPPPRARVHVCVRSLARINH